MWRRLLSPGTLIFIALWLLLMAAGRQAMFRDPGVFWHVVVGREILESGKTPREDHFSFTCQNRPWVADQWLAEAGMALVHRAAGWDGLLTLSVALLSAVYAILSVRLLRAGLHWLPTLLLLALTVLAGAHQFHVRPLLTTLLGTTVLYAGLIDLEAGRRGWPFAIGLVPLIWLWANLHGGVLAGIGMTFFCLVGWSGIWMISKFQSAALYTPGDSPRTRESPGIIVEDHRQKHLVQVSGIDHDCGGINPTLNNGLLFGWLLLGLGLLLIFVNPYGAALPKCWIETLLMPLPEIIQEHRRAAWTDLFSLAAVIIGIVYGAVFLGISFRRLRVTWLIPIVWFVLGALRVRFLPLFAMTAALALAEMLPQSRWTGWLQRRGLLGKSAEKIAHGEFSATSWIRQGLPFLIPVVLVTAIFILRTVEVPLPGFGGEWTSFDPRIAPDALREEIEQITENVSPGEGKIFNDMNYGGFLIYYAPRLRVFIDDRCLLYGTDFLLAYDQARRNHPEEIERWRQEHGFRYALVEAKGPFDRYLANSGRWTALGRTAAAALYGCDLGKTTDKR